MNRFYANGRERSQLVIENFDILSAACIKLNSLEDSSSVFKHTVDSATEFKSIDSAGIFVFDNISGDFVLEYSAGLSGCLVDSLSRCIPGSDLHGMLKNDRNLFPDPTEDDFFIRESGRQIFLKGIFPLILSETSSSVMFIASSMPGTLPREIQGIMETLVSMVKASISRIEVENSVRRSEREHSFLLESTNDPVFALDGNLEVKYCNGAFRQLVCSEDGSAPFSEVAGLELTSILREKFDEVLDSGSGFCISAFEYRDRTFNVLINRTPDGLFVLMNDITVAEQTRKKMNFRERFENLLITISTDFIKMRGSALNLGINDALLNIGVSIEVDRAYLFQFSDELRILKNTHEWCATNVQPQIDTRQELRTDEYPWLQNRLNRHWAFQIPRISDLPSWAEAERKLFESRDIQSLLIVPIVHGNNLIAFLGFDCVNQENYWSEDIIDLLRVVGDAIGNALVRNRMEKKLIEMYRRAEKEAQINAVLLKEVNHRVKNNLSEIIGILYAQRRYASSNDDHDEFVQSLISRIRGLATVHDMLSSSGWKPLELTMLARRIINSAITNAPDTKKLKASISKTSIRVNPNQAHALALILNELVRNSLKHALAVRDSLKIKVRMRKRRAGRITLIYSDNGPGYPEEVLEHDRKNLGLDLIQNLTIKNLQGDLTLQNDGGASAKIVFRRTLTEDGADGSK
ncbi:MAG: GAF domain-containing protein [Candidatus Aegiribacteria sp.]|nr:GAF domain-containing protein [Candidatus Aegiribacteria sp.]